MKKSEKYIKSIRSHRTERLPPTHRQVLGFFTSAGRRKSRQASIHVVVFRRKSRGKAASPTRKLRAVTRKVAAYVRRTGRTGKEKYILTREALAGWGQASIHERRSHSARVRYLRRL